MEYIIVARNPSNRKLIAILDFPGTHRECVAEYSSEDAAYEAAKEIPICRAWSYEIVEVDG